MLASPRSVGSLHAKNSEVVSFGTDGGQVLRLWQGKWVATCTAWFEAYPSKSRQAVEGVVRPAYRHRRTAMLNEHNRADDSGAKVLDLMIHGICRGWLPARAQSANESANGVFKSESKDLSPTAGHGLGAIRFLTCCSRYRRHRRHCDHCLNRHQICRSGWNDQRRAPLDPSRRHERRSWRESSRRARNRKSLQHWWNANCEMNDRLETPFRR